MYLLHPCVCVSWMSGDFPSAILHNAVPSRLLTSNLISTMLCLFSLTPMLRFFTSADRTLAEPLNYGRIHGRTALHLVFACILFKVAYGRFVVVGGFLASGTATGYSSRDQRACCLYSSLLYIGQRDKFLSTGSHLSGWLAPSQVVFVLSNQKHAWLGAEFRLR